MDTVKIAGFENRYASAFASLNYEWIKDSYEVEQHDRELLDHPHEHIIVPGGEIFFAIVNDEVVGAVALINISDGSFELAKMAVSPSARNKGIGRLLIESCIAHAAQLGKEEIVLESNTRQEAAVNLYRSIGFQETPLDPNSHYSRANIRMRLAILNSKL